MVSDKNAKATIDRKSETASSNWGRQRRIEFIDFRLCVDGKINRSDLIKFFGISVPQASLDLSYYRELVKNSLPARENLRYDHCQKIYLRTDDFMPLFADACSPNRILDNLKLLADNKLSSYNNYFGNSYSLGVADLQPIQRDINAENLSNIIDAINSHKAMHIVYLSVNAGKYEDYLIVPHSFGYDGFRWHVRAYSYDKHCFRDYVLSRIKSTDAPKIIAPNDRFPDPLGNGFREVGTDCASDADWNEIITLKLKANPELNPGAFEAIELDYGISEERKVIEYKVRKALLFYALRNLKVSKEYKVLPPMERQLVLDNEDEIYQIVDSMKD